MELNTIILNTVLKIVNLLTFLTKGIYILGADRAIHMLKILPQNTAVGLIAILCAGIAFEFPKAPQVTVGCSIIQGFGVVGPSVTDRIIRSIAVSCQPGI